MKRFSLLITNLPEYIICTAGDPEITAIVADSRRVQPGALFVAYKGVAVDGHRFVPDAVARGAAAIVIENDADIPAPKTVPCLRVPDGREALAHLSAAWYNHPSRRMTLIGVTGTDGKTSTINLIYHILKYTRRRAGMISTVNAVIGDRMLETGLHTTTPDAPDIQRYLAEMAAAGTEICLLETTSHGLAQHRVTGCAFNWAVVTNITHEHLDLHGSLEAYRQAKARLFQMAHTGAVLNRDDQAYDFLREKVATDVRVISYGVAQNADVRATDISLRPDAITFRAELQGRQVTVKTPLVGAFNISNVLAALAVTVEGVGVPVDDALRALKTFGGVPGRMERIDAGQPFTAIVDFAHTPNALRRALETVRALTEGRVIAVFGSAGLRDVEKRCLMGEVAAQLADITIITAEDPRTENLSAIIAATAAAMQSRGAAMVSGAALPAKITMPVFIREPDRGRAIFLATRLARPGDVVIVLGKGHEQSMCFGETEYPWDDRAAMRAALAGAPLLTLPTASP